MASVGAVGACLDVSFEGIPDPAIRLPKFAVCGAEGRLASKAGYTTELARLKLAPGAKQRALLYFDRMKVTLAAFDTYLAPKLAKYPALREVFYGAPDQAWKDARAHLVAGAVQHAAVAKFDGDHPKGRKAVAGCVDELRDALLVRLTTAKVGTVERALLGSRDAIGQPVVRALAACARLENQPEVEAAAKELVAGVDDLGRGGRTLAYWYVRDELAKLARDAVDIGFKERGGFQESGMPRPPSRMYPVAQTDGYVEYVLKAPVRAVKRKGAVAVVSFAEVRWQEFERECTQTNKVQSVDGNGNVLYQRRCKDLGLRTKRKTEAPVVVGAEHADALAAGRTVEMRCNETGERRRCFPAFVWSDSKQKRLVGFLGGKL